jgi:hypothetical protein
MTKMKLMACLAVAAVAALSVQAPANAANVTVGNSTAPWLGYMNVSNLPEDGGEFQFGSGWGVPDLVATFDDPGRTLTLSPNTIDDPAEYWYIGGGGPGAPGNKIMEANLYIEETDTLGGQTVTFSGEVLSNTFTGAHSTVAFIKDFAPDYSSVVTETVPLSSPGPFSLSLDTSADPGRHVQYGFATTGVNVWVTDVEPFGSLVLAAVPEPATISLLGLLGLAALGLRRRTR